MRVLGCPAELSWARESGEKVVFRRERCLQGWASVRKRTSSLGVGLGALMGPGGGATLCLSPHERWVLRPGSQRGA